MTPLRTAEAIAELAQGGVTFNETVIVADYSLGLEDVGSLRLVANKAGTILYETDPAAVSSMQEDYYQSGFFFPFSVNFTSLEEEGEGLWTLEHNAENLGEGGYFTYALYPMLSPNDFQKATRVRLFNAAGEVVADMHNPQNT